VGYSDLELSFKIYMRHTVLDQKKNSKNVLEKAFFFILSGFFLNWRFMLKILKVTLLRGEIFFLLEIGDIGYKRNQEFYADFKNPNMP
jgi:hypothetical protein